MDFLPDELMVYVFELLGCEVESHVKKPVCKRWRAFAQSVGSEHFHMSPYKDAGFHPLRGTQDSALSWEQRLKCLALDIDWDAVEVGNMRMKQNRQWLAQFQSRVDEVQHIIPRSQGLSQFHLTDSCSYIGAPNVHKLRPIFPLVCHHANLTTLKLDLRCYVFKALTDQEGPDELHICDLVATQIHNLKHLHLHISRVCSAIFKDMAPNRILYSLLTVIIDLSGEHSSQSMIDLCNEKSYGCVGARCACKGLLVQSVRARMHQMPALETLKILGVKSSPGRPRRTALDCCTGHELDVDCGKPLVGPGVLQTEF